mmetsp:Transcript_98500/g.257310  ORF Transcript_98500/g.257310 Transcript_98500/m.257310 type:complete len:474 (-) Transcript_98500:70-1491(-)
MHACGYRDFGVVVNSSHRPKAPPPAPSPPPGSFGPPRGKFGNRACNRARLLGPKISTGLWPALSLRMASMGTTKCAFPKISAEQIASPRAVADEDEEAAENPVATSWPAPESTRKISSSSGGMSANSCCSVQGPTPPPPAVRALKRCCCCCCWLAKRRNAGGSGPGDGVLLRLSLPLPSSPEPPTPRAFSLLLMPSSWMKNTTEIAKANPKMKAAVSPRNIPVWAIVDNKPVTMPSCGSWLGHWLPATPPALPPPLSAPMPRPAKVAATFAKAAALDAAVACSGGFLSKAPTAALDVGPRDSILGKIVGPFGLSPDAPSTTAMFSVSAIAAFDGTRASDLVDNDESAAISATACGFDSGTAASSAPARVAAEERRFKCREVCNKEKSRQSSSSSSSAALSSSTLPSTPQGAARQDWRGAPCTPISAPERGLTSNSASTERIATTVAEVLRHIDLGPPTANRLTTRLYGGSLPK